MDWNFAAFGRHWTIFFPAGVLVLLSLPLLAFGAWKVVKLFLMTVKG